MASFKRKSIEGMQLNCSVKFYSRKVIEKLFQNGRLFHSPNKVGIAISGDRLSSKDRYSLVERVSAPVPKCVIAMMTE